MKYSELMNEKKKQWVVKRDGKVKYKAKDENDAYIYLQKAQSQSADWAMKHEGWEIVQESTLTEALKNKIDISKIKPDSKQEDLILDIDKAGKEGVDYKLVGSKLQYSDKLKKVVSKYVKENKQEGENKMNFSNFIKEQEEKKDDNGKSPDVQGIIGDLIKTQWSSSDDEQSKAGQLLKGLFYSDDPKAKKFLKNLDKLTSGMKPEDYK